MASELTGKVAILCMLLLHVPGLLKKQEGGKPAFPVLKRAFRLLVEGVDDRAPADIAFAYSGYAPLLVRFWPRLHHACPATPCSGQLGLPAAFAGRSMLSAARAVPPMGPAGSLLH